MTDQNDQQSDKSTSTLDDAIKNAGGTSTDTTVEAPSEKMQDVKDAIRAQGHEVSEQGQAAPVASC